MDIILNYITLPILTVYGLTFFFYCTRSKCIFYCSVFEMFQLCFSAFTSLWCVAAVTDH